MPKIIFKCRYLRNGAHIGNLVEYMATREGVEKLPEDIRAKPATEIQRQLVSKVLDQFPEAADLFEYEDYRKQSTIENASEFITAAMEQNVDQLGHSDVYVQYIATRPHVEKAGAHGIFSDDGEPIVLSRVVDEVSHHEGNVWTPIISLLREDAARLGYDHAAAWMALLRKQRNLFAEQMKIAPENLRWYAAFHNESHHPHCHMVVYSSDPREGYVTKSAINNMRSAMAREIFQQDLMQIYPEQTARRNELAEQSRAALSGIIAKMESGVCESKDIEDLLSQLAESLKHTAGKKQYGYLKADVKALVDRIVDELAKDARVAEAYRAWYALRDEVLRTYADNLPEPLPLSRQKEFKQIKNMVIAEAVNLGSRHVTFEGDENAGPSSEEEDAAGESEPELPLPELPETSADRDDFPYDNASGDAPDQPGDTLSGKPHIAWNDRYKAARTFFFGSDETEPDFEQALRLFREEAEKGNALAIHDLGRMAADGLGVEIDAGAAFGWYAKALAAFENIESEKENRYVEYRIGKMYAAGLGTEQDYEAAAGWLGKAVSKNHKYAQYSLAGLYFRGQGVEQSDKTAFSLYLRAALQHMPYADYELAKMYLDGVGTSVNSAGAARHFKIAFQEFQQMEKQSRDDKLQYRLGQMLYTGTGTEKNVKATLVYFEKSARLGNAHAQYMLGRIYLDADSGHENAKQAVRWLTKSADGGNALAQYALGKLCRDGNHVKKDIQKAIAFFTSAAEQNNSYAAYALGKLYLQEESIPKDEDAAVKWLTESAGLGNQFAQCTLAKLYLSGENVPKDIRKALELLQKSAAQGNSFAQYRLGRLYQLGEDIPKNADAALRWLTPSAEQGNQYAQYALGKLYLLGEDVPKDVDAAVRWLTASAGQGNPYAQFFLNHMDSYRNPSLFPAATRLMHQLSRIFREQQSRLYGGPGMGTDSKLRRRLLQKKIAMGHAPDDPAPRQTY